MFDVYYFGENEKLLDLIPIAKRIEVLDAVKPMTKMYWIVDRGAEVVDAEVFQYRPPEYDQCYRHICLDSDGNYAGLQLHTTYFELGTKDLVTGSLNKQSFPIVEDPDTFFKNNNTVNNVWVVDKNVDQLITFDFSFVPVESEMDRTHVWQKLNPVTMLPYDYVGIKLLAREAKQKSRLKYMRIPACKHKTFPVYYLQPSYNLIEQLEDFDRQTDNTMFYVIDPYTELDPEFKFDYYPTQWDDMNVHVFLSEDGQHKNVRLYPKDTFNAHMYDDNDVLTNNFEKLKTIDVVASKKTIWPVITFTDKATFIEQIENATTSYVWSIDNDVEVLDDIITEEFKPEPKFKDKVHVWQRLNPHTNTAHSYGGLRLWPTFLDYSSITTDQLNTNRLKNIHHVRTPGAVYMPYQKVFISYKDNDAEQKFNASNCDIWIKDIEGIFDAHKAAAEQVTSKMFWVVDADAKVSDDFDFSYIPDKHDQEVVHVWHSVNPITGQEYGYGGVKLFNTQQIRDATSWGLDFTTGLSTRFKVMPQVSCVTKFNTSAFNTWRSAFREAVKLTVKGDKEALDRLEGWLHPVPNAMFRHDAKEGAECGQTYAKKNINNSAALAKINDFEWLEEYYEQHRITNVG